MQKLQRFQLVAHTTKLDTGTTFFLQKHVLTVIQQYIVYRLVSLYVQNDTGHATSPLHIVISLNNHNTFSCLHINGAIR